MAKVLLLFIQSKTVDAYVNVLTHCVREEGVREIYFVGRKEPAGKDFELLEFIGQIRDRIAELAEEYPEYVPGRDLMPSLAQVEDRVIRIVFVRPQDAIPEVKKRFSDLTNLVVDVTGCDKRLASDVITSFTASGINHVRYFGLSDKVFSSEWKEMKRTKLYHDLKGDVTYYKYDDFSESGATILTLNRLRAQGRLIRALIFISALLGFAVAILINTQQTTLAQITALLLALVTGFGFLEDGLSLLDRFRK